jgi:hypothetical protein
MTMTMTQIPRPRRSYVPPPPFRTQLEAKLSLTCLRSLFIFTPDPLALSALAWSPRLRLTQPQLPRLALSSSLPSVTARAPPLPAPSPKTMPPSQPPPYSPPLSPTNVSLTSPPSTNRERLGTTAGSSSTMSRRRATTASGLYP